MCLYSQISPEYFNKAVFRKILVVFQIPLTELEILFICLKITKVIKKRVNLKVCVHEVILIYKLPGDISLTILHTNI
jgi:hypothetical protein